MSKDMKLIMENWRKLVKEEKEQVIEGPMMAAAALGLSGFGSVEEIPPEKVSQAIELAQSYSDHLEKEGKMKSAKLADEAVGILKSYSDPELDVDKDGYVDWGNRDVSSVAGEFAEEFLTIALDDAKAEKLMNVWTAEKQDDASSKTMQQRMRDANQKGFKAGTGGLGPMQE